MKNEATDLLARLQRYNKQQILDRLKQTDPTLFEHLVALLFERRGFRAETVGKSGDEGVDVRLQKGKHSAVVQVKRYADSVGQPTIRDLYGTMLHNDADEAYLVTTAQVTRQAKEWASGKPITFVDGFALTEWIVESEKSSTFGWFGLKRVIQQLRRNPSSKNEVLTKTYTERKMNSPHPETHNNHERPTGGLRFWFWPLVVLAILLFGVAIGIAYNRLAPRLNLASPVTEATPIELANSVESGEGDNEATTGGDEGDNTETAGGSTDTGNNGTDNDGTDGDQPAATQTPQEEATPTPQPTIESTPTDAAATATEVPTEVPTEAPTATEVPTLAPTPTWTPERDNGADANACPIPVDGEFQPFYNASLGCPVDTTGLHWAAWQAFERGYLLWRSDTDAAYAFYGPAAGTWFEIPERWDGATTAPRGEPPSTNLVAPERGFGYVWGIRDDIFENLGWATDIEKGFCALIQPFDGGYILQSIPVDSCTAERLFNNAMSADWQPITVIASADQQFTIR